MVKATANKRLASYLDYLVPAKLEYTTVDMRWEQEREAARFVVDLINSTPGYAACYAAGKLTVIKEEDLNLE